MGLRPNMDAEMARRMLDASRARVRGGLERAAPLLGRLDREVRKHPKIAGGIDAIGAVWTKLVASFCATIDPVLSRYFPDLRLVAVTTATGAIELFRAGKSGVTPIGVLADLDPEQLADLRQTKWTAIELRLRPEQVLRRTLSLPGASRDFLGPIIEHRLERLTPWRPERVLYGYTPTGEAEAGGAIAVALVATSKDVVAEPMRALSEIGLVPTAIGAAEGSPAEPIGINMLRATAKTMRSDSRKMVSRVALASFGVLAVLYLASSFWASSATDDQEAAGARLLKARRLLKTASLGAVGSREKALLDAKVPDKAMMVLIDKLSTAIPRDTYLKELAVTPDKVRLVGTSSNAPALVGELEASGLVNVRFTAAVTREKDQRDSFEITADRAGAGAGGILADAP